MEKKIFMGFVIILFTIALAGPSSATFQETFTDLNPKIIGAALDFGFSENVSFSITNSTNMTWYDFHLQVALGPAGTLGTAFFTDGLDNSWDIYSGAGSYTLSGNNDKMDIVGLSIAPGGIYDFTVDIAAGESGWIMGAYPTVTGNGSSDPVVPEPATILLLGFGLLGLAGLSRKKK